MPFTLDEIKTRETLKREMRKIVGSFSDVIQYSESIHIAGSGERPLFGWRAQFGGDDYPDFVFHVLRLKTPLHTSANKVVQIWVGVQPVSSTSTGYKEQIGQLTGALNIFERWVDLVKDYYSYNLTQETTYTIELLKSFGDDVAGDKKFNIAEQSQLLQYLEAIGVTIQEDSSVDPRLSQVLLDETSSLKQDIENVTVDEFRRRLGNVIGTTLRRVPKLGLKILEEAEKFLYKKGFEYLWGHLPLYIETVRHWIKGLN